MVVANCRLMVLQHSHVHGSAKKLIAASAWFLYAGVLSPAS
jgi:hypothetical protein